MPEKNYPLARGFTFLFPDGTPKCFVGIVAATRTQAEHDQLVQEIDDSMFLLQFIIDGCETIDDCQSSLNGYCRGIEKDHGYECYAIIGQYFCGWQYSEQHNIYKEGLPYG